MGTGAYPAEDAMSGGFVSYGPFFTPYRLAFLRGGIIYSSEIRDT